MTTKAEEAKTDRRGFLKIAGIGTVTGGVALATGKSAEATELTEDGAGKGYAETDHVKTFYKTARF
jgi:hypothetical protein